jgi:nitrate/TMAO reductase-like tetraheme cytochrome c subunit
MSRNEFTSIFLPGTPVPDPPDWRPFFYLILQIIFILVFVCFIGFLVFETVMDAIGKPIWIDGVDIVRQQTTPPSQEDVVAAQFILLSPLPNSKINSSRVTILCTWKPDSFTQLKSHNKLIPPYEPELFIDGQHVGWAVKYETCWLVQVDLKSGLHNLRVSKNTVEIIVDLPDENLAEYTTTKLQNKNTNKNTNTNYLRDNDNDYKIKRFLWPVMRSHESVGDADKCVVCHNIVAGKESTVANAQRKKLQPVNGSKSCVSCHDKKNIHTTHGNKLDIWENCSKCHVLHGTTIGNRGLLRKDFLP